MPNVALNGWICSIFGLADVLKVEEDAHLRQALDSTLGAITALLPRYDAGYWSFYDLQGNLASPFYHKLHIVMLEALALEFPHAAGAINATRAVFASQQASSWNRIRAFAGKAWQKLRKPTRTILR